MKGKVQAQRKFAQGVYIPPSVNERRVEPKSQKSHIHDEPPKVRTFNMKAATLLDFVSFSNVHRHGPPVVLLEKLEDKSPLLEIQQTEEKSPIIEMETSPPKQIVKPKLQLRRLKTLASKKKILKRVVKKPTVSPTVQTRKRSLSESISKSPVLAKQTRLSSSFISDSSSDDDQPLTKLSHKKKSKLRSLNSSNSTSNSTTSRPCTRSVFKFKNKFTKTKSRVFSNKVQLKKPSFKPRKTGKQLKHKNVKSKTDLVVQHKTPKPKEKQTNIKSNEQCEKVKFDENNLKLKTNEKNTNCKPDEKHTSVRLNDKNANNKLIINDKFNEKDANVKSNEKRAIVKLSEKDTNFKINDKLTVVKINEKVTNIKLNEKNTITKLHEKHTNLNLNEKHAFVKINEKDTNIKTSAKVASLKHTNVKTNEKHTAVKLSEKPTPVKQDEQEANVLACPSSIFQGIKNIEDTANINMEDCCKKCANCEILKKIYENNSNQQPDVYMFHSDSENESEKSKSTPMCYRNHNKKTEGEEHCMYLDFFENDCPYLIQIVKIVNKEKPLMRARVLPKSEVNQSLVNKSSSKSHELLAEANFLKELLHTSIDNKSNVSSDDSFKKKTVDIDQKDCSITGKTDSLEATLSSDSPELFYKNKKKVNKIDTRNKELTPVGSKAESKKKVLTKIGTKAANRQKDNIQNKREEDKKNIRTKYEVQHNKELAKNTSNKGDTLKEESSDKIVSRQREELQICNKTQIMQKDELSSSKIEIRQRNEPSSSSKMESRQNYDVKSDNKSESRESDNAFVDTIKSETSQKEETEKAKSSRNSKEFKLQDAPVFKPTPQQFENPLEYIEEIRSEAEKYGICKIVAPEGFNPPCKEPDDLNFLSTNQYISKMYKRWNSASREMCAIKSYLATQNVLFKRAPLLNGVEVDLPNLYHAVQKRGGLRQVLAKKKWPKVAEDMNYGNTVHIGKKLDKIYEKYVLPYGTLTLSERQEIKDKVDRDWMKRYKKMLARASNPLHRQKRILGESSSDEEEEAAETSCLDEAEDCVVPGRIMNLQTFKKIAQSTQEIHFAGASARPAAVEQAYWRHVARGARHVSVCSASIDSGDAGYGFPTARHEPYARHPWNLKVLSNSPGSILRSMGSVLSVTVPTLHLGMTFSTSCWHRDPHGLPWIEYLHEGPAKIWYGISSEHSDTFRSAVEQLAPAYCQNKDIWLPSDIAMFPPSALLAHRVPLAKLTQRPKEFVVVFPKAYSSSISTGFTISESIYFATSAWLKTMESDFQAVSNSCEPTMFSLEHALLALAADARVASLRPLLAEPLLARLRAEQRLRARLRAVPIRQNVNRLPPQKKWNYSWNVGEHTECDVCRKTLYLSKVIGVLGKNSDLCLRHALQLLEARQKSELPTILATTSLIYFYTDEALNDVINDLDTTLNQIP